jgi:UPF0755 protein
MSEHNPGEWRDPETGKIDRHELMYKVRAAFAVVVSLAVLMGGGWFIFDKAQAAWYDYRTTEDYLGAGVAPVQVTIPKGASVPQIAQILVSAGVIKSAKTFTAAAAASTSSIQAGKYNLMTQLPAKDALARLLDTNNQVHNRFTLKDGKWISDQATAMSAATGIPEAEFTAAYADWKNLGVPSWAKNGVEGFLYPDTYELPDKPTAKSTIMLATKQFKTVANGLDLVNAAKKVDSDKLSLSPYDVVVLASMVEKEAGSVEGDRAKIARVFLNRLETNATAGKLQSDATVAYGLKIKGRVWTTIPERAVKTDWNTYLNKGLPKSPITSPSKKSLEAVLKPADGNWLYFVAVNLDTGETLFTDNYEQHVANTQKLQQWCDDTKSPKC